MLEIDKLSCNKNPFSTWKKSFGRTSPKMVEVQKILLRESFGWLNHNDTQQKPSKNHLGGSLNGDTILGNPHLEKAPWILMFAPPKWSNFDCFIRTFDSYFFLLIIHKFLSRVFFPWHAGRFPPTPKRLGCHSSPTTQQVWSQIPPPGEREGWNSLADFGVKLQSGKLT